AGSAYRSMASSDSIARSAPTRSRPLNSWALPPRSTLGGVGTVGGAVADGGSSGARVPGGRLPKSRTEADDPPPGRALASSSRASRIDDRLPSADGPGAAPRLTPDAGSTTEANGISGLDGGRTGVAARKSTPDRGVWTGAGMTPAASDGGYRMSNLTSDSPVPPSPAAPNSISDSLRPDGAV